MAFELKLDFSDPCDCKGIRIKNLTGLFASDNVGGYDPDHISGNPATGDIATMTGTFIFSDGTTKSGVNLLTAGLNETTEQWHTINSAAIGLGANTPVPDQLGSLTVHMTGTVSGTPFDYSKSFYFYPTCQIACCVKKMGAKVTKDMTLKDAVLANFVKAKAWLDEIRFSVCECCDIQNADELYAALKTLCTENNANCKTC